VGTCYQSQPDRLSHPGIYFKLILCHHPTAPPRSSVLPIQVPGEGWIDDLYGWFGAPQWVQVYDRRSKAPVVTQVPVGQPTGGTLPLIPDPAGVQVPAVVLGSQPPPIFTQTPPLIPNGLPDLPPGSMGNGENGDTEMALQDWLSGAVDIANVWGGYTSSQLANQFKAGLPAAAQTPTILAPAVGQMGDNGHWVPARRRRRRRPCLTQTDINILHQIGNLPNNANVRTALARCIK